MTVPFRKYHGTGNDFAVVRPEDLPASRRQFAIEWCGEYDADGVLVLDLDTDADPARIGFRLYQPDGSTAAMCGNGARIAARWGMEQTGEHSFVLSTPAGERPATVHDDGSVTVTMGTPTFDPASVPLDREEPMIEEPLEGFDVTAVNSGVPHAVSFVEDVDGIDITEEAPPIRHAEVFPEGANATFATRRSDGSFRQRTFERGVEGETQSCGTGAVAIVAVADRLSLVDGSERVDVHPPGGTLIVTATSEEAATLRGPTAFEFEGTFEFDPRGEESRSDDPDST
ncbi:MAG: diaminopimelate epimerase [Halodesulfurarchaeum sp.]